MKFLRSILVFVLVLLSQWFLSRTNLGFPPPLVAFLLLVWFWQMRLDERLVWALIGGVVFDAFSIYPIGAHMIVFTLMALIIHFLQQFLANAPSLVTRGFGLMISLSFYFLLLSLVAVTIAHPGATDALRRFWNQSTLFYAMEWVIVLPLSWSVLHYFFRKYT